MNSEEFGGPRRILVVEDEMLVCLVVETALEDAGYAVSIAGSIQEALEAIDRERPHAAILDLNLKGVKVYPVAEKLAAIGVPFVFASGGGTDIEGFDGRPQVGKPFREAQLLDAIARLLE